MPFLPFSTYVMSYHQGRDVTGLDFWGASSCSFHICSHFGGAQSLRLIDEMGRRGRRRTGRSVRTMNLLCS